MPGSHFCRIPPGVTEKLLFCVFLPVSLTIWLENTGGQGLGLAGLGKAVPAQGYRQNLRREPSSPTSLRCPLTVP